MKKCNDGRRNNVIPDYAKEIVVNKRVHVDLPENTTVKRSTEKAYLLEMDGKEYWAPKSMCQMAGDAKRIAKFVADGWSKESDYE